MFTGLVEGIGIVDAVVENGPGVDVTLEVPDALPRREDARIGDSVSINGCCLTIVAIDGSKWTFQAGSETLSRTNLGKLVTGSRVNLERSLRPTDRLGGHFVQGHIDGTAIVDRVEPEGDWTFLWFQVPEELTRQMVSKGSSTVDGVSLTLVEVESARFSVALIPHTLEQTTLGERAVGDVVNIETDILGKYVEKLIRQGISPADWGGNLPGLM